MLCHRLHVTRLAHLGGAWGGWSGVCSAGRGEARSNLIHAHRWLATVTRRVTLGPSCQSRFGVKVHFVGLSRHSTSFPEMSPVAASPGRGGQAGHPRVASLGAEGGLALGLAWGEISMH